MCISVCDALAAKLEVNRKQSSLIWFTLICFLYIYFTLQNVHIFCLHVSFLIKETQKYQLDEEHSWHHRHSSLSWAYNINTQVCLGPITYNINCLYYDIGPRQNRVPVVDTMGGHHKRMTTVCMLTWHGHRYHTTWNCILSVSALSSLPILARYTLLCPIIYWSFYMQI